MTKKNIKKMKSLVSSKEKWEDEWEDMPEYICLDEASFKSINVHFRNKEDLQEFADLIDQSITMKTKSIWYPEMTRRDLSKRWVSKNE